jgi:WD repeat and FYVE domain-containing protein 2
VSCLVWDANKKFLFSGSHDKTIICWDIGGQKGITYDLEGHKDRVHSLVLVELAKKLISGSEDNKIVIWDMNAKRKENPEWHESDFCETCKSPFFWNFRTMWEKKIVGKRQHHCRRCGAAICDECSKNRSIIPILGHEFQVRICNECTRNITEEELV